MHGVIVFSTRSGACLFARAFTENFGLPGEWCTHGDGESSSPTGRSFGAVQLAGFLFALSGYAADLGTTPEGAIDAAKGVGSTASGVARSKKGRFGATPEKSSIVRKPRRAEKRSENESQERRVSEVRETEKYESGGCSLRRWSSRDVSITFAEHARCGVAVALFAPSDMGVETPEKLAGSVLSGFVQKHGARFHDGGGGELFGFGGPSKTLTFANEFFDLIKSLPVEIARDLAREADVGSTWMYVALFAEDAPEDAEGEEDVKRNARNENRKTRRNSLRVGDRSGVSFAPNAETEGETRARGRFGSANGNETFGRFGCFPGRVRSSLSPTGRSARDPPEPARRIRREGVLREDLVRRSFVARCAPERTAPSAFSDSNADASWSLPPSEETLRGLALASLAASRASRPRGRLTCCEAAVSSRTAPEGTFFPGSENRRRVLMFRDENVLVALPVDTECAREGTSHQTHPAAVRGRIASLATRLKCLMRFLERSADLEGGAGGTPVFRFPGEARERYF